MDNPTSTTQPKRKLTPFFLLTFIISLPFYFVVSLVTQEMAILVGTTMTLAPITAGLILSFREDGLDGAKTLLKRSFDYKRIAEKIWYLTIFFIWPIVFILAYVVTSFIGETIPDLLFPLVFSPVLFGLFFIFALFEEVGWMGYAFDPMETRWGALKASLALGLIWAFWHLAVYIFAGQDTLWIAGQMISLVGVRAMIVWIYNNTGKSVFAAILFHAVYNLCALMVPSFSTSTGHLITTIVIIITTLAVIILWDPHTLTHIRFRKVERGL